MDKSMMSGGLGMSPRKAMAGGADGGNFGVASYPGHARRENPDHAMKTGEKGHMYDADRGVGMPINHSKDMHPAQAAPRHGMMHKSMDFDRSDKV